MADLTLRRVTPDLWESHRDLRLAMLRETPTAFLTQYDDVVGLDEAAWRDRLAGSWHTQALLDGEPVGSVGLYVEDGRARLVAMYVAPSARGRHVGERLVQAVLDEAGMRGLPEVGLEVTEGNEPAIHLYRRMGFDFTGESWPHPRFEGQSELGMLRPTGDPDGTSAETRPVSSAPGMAS